MNTQQPLQKTLIIAISILAVLIVVGGAVAVVRNKRKTTASKSYACTPLSASTNGMYTLSFKGSDNEITVLAPLPQDKVFCATTTGNGKRFKAWAIQDVNTTASVSDYTVMILEEPKAESETNRLATYRTQFEKNKQSSDSLKDFKLGAYRGNELVYTRNNQQLRQYQLFLGPKYTLLIKGKANDPVISNMVTGIQVRNI